ncbi:MAG: radical SAM protein [Dictyoglomaceae bacterium]
MQNKGGDIFLYIIWILDSKCNLNCSHCYVHSRGWERKISKERGLKLIEEAKRADFKGIDFTGGEPLLIPEIFDYIKKAKEVGLEVSINSNALLLNKDIVKFLKEYEVFVYISVDGPNKESYEKIRGKNTFENLVKNLELIKEESLEYSIIFSISSLNYNFAKDMVSFAKDFSAKSLCMIPVIPAGEAKRTRVYIDSSLLISTIKEVKEEAERLKYPVEVWCASFLKLFFDSPYLIIDECPIFDLLDISPSGDILICDVIDNPLSEIRTKSLLSAINEVKNHPLYKLILERKENCTGCKIKDFCRGGCYARALIFYNDFSKKDPLCPKVLTPVG